MDTKSRSISKRIVFAVSILIIASLVSSLFFLANKMTNSMEIVVQKDFYQSDQLENNTIINIYRLADLLNVYKSEDNILAGNTAFLDEHDLPWELRDDYDDFEENYRKDNLNADELEIMTAFVDTDTDDIKTYKSSKINSDLMRYKDILTFLESNGVYYYIESEDVKMTNRPDFTKENYTNSKVFFTFDSSGSSSSFDEFNFYMSGTRKLDHFPQDTLYMTYSQALLDKQTSLWHTEQNIYKPSIIAIFGLGFILALGLIYLAYDYSEEVFPWIRNSMYFDVRLLMSIGIMIPLFALSAESYRILGLYFIIPASLIIALFAVNLYLSLVKHVYDKTLVQKQLTVQLFLKVIGYFVLILTKLPIMIRMAPSPYKASDLKSIINGVREIKDGDLEHVIQTKSKGLYRRLANDINSITDGLKAAVHKKMKSDRMRTELISNVSHDIRTPLTSIITYVDLMKRSDDDTEKAKYLDIIDQKSQRLKNLTDDLFEASKANSGNIPVKLETIDLQELLAQCLGELSEKIENSSLEFSINNYHQHKYVLADGSLMFRIIENLMSNIFKYSLERSRVYINIEEDEDHLYLVFKNISAYPLNIKPDDLFERFKRGDESRTTEGSGLGLSITENLINLQNGVPLIQIDGDLFKFTVKLKKAH